jgi:dihydroorotate dehydrogenase electron transfer subunit
MGNESLRGGFWLLRLEAPHVACDCIPGQFIMLRGLGADWPYLRRPFSIYSSDGESTVEIVYKVVGRATSIMARTNGGEYEILGPLGKGFALPAHKYTLALAGGAGLPPVAYYCQKYVGLLDKVVLVIGGRTKTELLIPVGLVAQGVEIRPYTDDGSKGARGTVVCGLVKALGEASGGAGSGTREASSDGSGCDGRGAGRTDGEPGEPTHTQRDGLHVVACGPKQMLARVASVCDGAGVPCEASVEEVMACGVGACLACAVPRKGGGYLHACSEGPVFEAGTIDWERWL